MTPPELPWYRELNKYHWFVLAVAALGWLFDTMDQQLFTLARVPAIRELLAVSGPVNTQDVDFWSGVATAVFLMGWATGGIAFGIMGDAVGRAKTMMVTILLYSLCTGLSALSVYVGDFLFYRFITGLGVGGEFAVGVALVAEVMPEKARARALALLQALSAVGNVTAALIGMSLGWLETSMAESNQTMSLFGIAITPWRLMFVIGTLPALLAVVVRRSLKEPEKWKNAQEVHDPKKVGGITELFSDPRWRYRALIGLIMSSSGVIGLWGIGFFSVDVNRSIFQKVFQQEFREKGGALADQQLIATLLANPDRVKELKSPIPPEQILSLSAEYPTDAGRVFGALTALQKAAQPVSVDTVIAELDRQDQEPEAAQRKAGRRPISAEQRIAARERQRVYMSVAAPASLDVAAEGNRIGIRTKQLGGLLGWWAGVTSLMMNIGAFFGMYTFGYVTQIIGRRPAFAIAYLAALFSTAFVFWQINDITDIFWMMPLMGFCQLSLFGGFAIYLPELFPTRLRSTGTSFCYNIGRFVAAVGPWVFGLLTSTVYANQAEPGRWAAITMCSIFLLGLSVLPFAPETKGQPLPD